MVAREPVSATTKPKRCEGNAIPPEEDLGAPFHIEYRPCGKPAEWRDEDGLWLCDRCAR